MDRYLTIIREEIVKYVINEGIEVLDSHVKVLRQLLPIIITLKSTDANGKEQPELEAFLTRLTVYITQIIEAAQRCVNKNVLTEDLSQYGINVPNELDAVNPAAWINNFKRGYYNTGNFLNTMRGYGNYAAYKSRGRLTSSNIDTSIPLSKLLEQYDNFLNDYNTIDRKYKVSSTLSSSPGSAIREIGNLKNTFNQLVGFQQNQQQQGQQQGQQQQQQNQQQQGQQQGQQQQQQNQQQQQQNQQQQGQQQGQQQVQQNQQSYQNGNPQNRLMEIINEYTSIKDKGNTKKLLHKCYMNSSSLFNYRKSVYDRKPGTKDNLKHYAYKYFYTLDDFLFDISVTNENYNNESYNPEDLDSCLRYYVFGERERGQMSLADAIKRYDLGAKYAEKIGGVYAKLYQHPDSIKMRQLAQEYLNIANNLASSGQLLAPAQRS